MAGCLAGGKLVSSGIQVTPLSGFVMAHTFKLTCPRVLLPALLLAVLGQPAQAVDLNGWQVTIDGVPVCADPRLDYAKREVACQSDAVKIEQIEQALKTEIEQAQADELRREQEARLLQVQRQCRSDPSYASVLGSALRYEGEKNICIEKASGREQPCPDCPIIVRSAPKSPPLETIPVKSPSEPAKR